MVLSSVFFVLQYVFESPPQRAPLFACNFRSWAVLFPLKFNSVYGFVSAVCFLILGFQCFDRAIAWFILLLRLVGEDFCKCAGTCTLSVVSS